MRRFPFVCLEMFSLSAAIFNSSLSLPISRSWLRRLRICQATRKYASQSDFLCISRTGLRGPRHAHLEPRRFLTSQSLQSLASPHSPVAESMPYIKFDDLHESEQALFQVLQYEFQMLTQSEQGYPSQLTEKQWRKTLTIYSKNGRRKYFQSLVLLEAASKRRKTNQNERIKLEQMKIDEIKEKMARDPTVLRYGVSFNTLTRKVPDSDMNKFYNHRLAWARLFGQPLVFDLDYDPWMAEHEQVNTAMQILTTQANNKLSRDPFWIQLCNALPDGATLPNLLRGIPSLYSASCMMEVSEKSCLELFPRERLVYLSPDAGDTLEVFSHDDIYVIGGFVDKSMPEKRSILKAERDGLRRAKLPLDKFLRWGPGGSKCLTLDQVAGILGDMKLHGDWKKSLLKHVPRRKYLLPEDLDPGHPDGRRMTRLPLRQRIALSRAKNLENPYVT